MGQPPKYHKHIRLRGNDHRQGEYFVTLNGAEMNDVFSEFAKGNVICKYQMIERIGNHKRRNWIFSFLLTLWIGFWLWMGMHTHDPWVTIVIALLPFLLGSILFKLAFPYRVVGLVTFQGSTITFTQANGIERSVDLHALRSLQIFRSVPRTFEGKVRTPPEAYGIAIRKGDETWEYHVLNKLHVTKADELQFMSPPPPLSMTLSILMDQFRIRFYDRKDRELESVP